MREMRVGFNTYCIGVGRAGIRFLDSMYGLDVKSGVKQISPLGLASSKFDYDLIDNLGAKHIFPFGDSDRDVRYTCVGGNQCLGQEIAIGDGRRILARIYEDISTEEREELVHAITLIGSLAGGTGGSTIPVLAKMIKDNFPEKLVVIMGILPEEQEGSTYLANASRSFNMIMSLRRELADRYADVFFIFNDMVARRGGILQSYGRTNQKWAETFNLLFGSTYNPDNLDPHDRLSFLKKGGKEGIGMMRYTGDLEVDNPNPQTDMEVEDAKSEIIRALKKNLAEYPPGTVKSGAYGLYQMRCDQSIFPFDVRNIMNESFEKRLQEGSSDKYAFVRGGIWPNQGSEQLDIATMILGIEPTEYRYLDKIMRKWTARYRKEDMKKDFEQIVDTMIII